VNIAAGAIVRSTDVSADFSWTLSGAVPGGASGTFAPLSIGGGGEQIYAFQGPTNLPLQNPTAQLFLLDDTNGFENAVDSSTGNVPAGLTSGSTALTFNLAAANFIAFNTSVLSSGAKSDWLAAISNSANWTSGAAGTLPSGSINVVPEPSTSALALLGAVVIGMHGLLRGRKNLTHSSLLQ
jgi:hypothetical protein